MSVLLKNVTNAIWHAFNALLQEEPGLVNKSKLKVLTANIATVLDLYGVEKGLDHFRSGSTLTFESFRFYLQQEVFSTLPSSTLTMRELRNYEEKIEEICWLICRTKYAKKKYGNLRDIHLFKLFRIFCLLSDLKVMDIDKKSNSNISEVLLNSSEAVLVMKQIMTALGLDIDEDKRINNLTEHDLAFRFDQFLELVNYKGCNSPLEYEASLHEAIEDMYQTYLKDIIKKGYLLRKGYLLPTFKEYWFILQPCELSYYKNHTEKELSGTIILDPKCAVRPSPLANTNLTHNNNSSVHSNGKHHHQHHLRFTLSSGERNFELATHDHRTRMQWISAFQLAITYSTGKEGYQRDIISRRRNKRELELKRRKAEEEIRSTHIQEVEKAKNQLEQEKQARLAAEIQAKELEVIARADSQRVAELEDIKSTLEKLLQEETQAKRDEEIVRTLQARVLAEEWEKREELEQLQKEQKLLLEQERQKRIEFEVKQQEKESKLKEAELKLKQLEDERKRLDMELKQARFKIIRSEENKEDLEARMDALLPLFSPNGSGKGSGASLPGIRRTLSFIATSRERPTAIENIRATGILKKSKN